MMMVAIFLFIQIFLFGTIDSSGKMIQESVLIKHNSKIIDHGYFIFCSIEGDMINETTFSYSLNLEKQTFTVTLVGSEIMSLDAKGENYTSQFNDSEDWNRERIGTPIEKYFLVFDPGFLVWNNLEKLNFFLRVCKNE